MESLPTLFLSEQYISDKNKYQLTIQEAIINMQGFLNSIEINKNYYRTGIIVKNPKYKKKVSGDTNLIKSFKTSLNKMSSMNYIQLSSDITNKLSNKSHLYPLVIQYIFEQALLHHNYSKYYCYLVELLHKQFNNQGLIESQLDSLYTDIVNQTKQSDSEYSNLCSKNKQLDQLIGYNLFLSELEMNQLISNKTDTSIKLLLDTLNQSLSEEELYKCVVCLYTLFKSKYGTDDIPEQYLEPLTKVKSNIQYMKIKFKLMDILERR
tara:strand:+ start:3345 stop:4139 length:795 start_codon:yes stop_codon:yes gene_type:complete